MLVRDIGKTNCLTEIPQDIDLRFKEFVQPVLTENGTMGGDTFACDQSDYFTETSGEEQKAWRVFDGNKSVHEWQVNTVSLTAWYWLSWYNPQPIKISKVGVRDSSASYSILAWKLQGSNDNSTWTDLITGTHESITGIAIWYMEVPEEKQGFYKYYRIYCQPRSTTALMIRELTITAVESTIVLKAGSKYYRPAGKDTNGKPVFEKITTTRDISSSWNTSLLATNGQRVLFLANSTSFDGAPQNIKAVCSTDGAPTTNSYNRAYDYTNNFMYYRSATVGWTISNTYSLPIALITSTNGYITSIDQVFNDFGFIGSTMFALLGVKGLNPNGFENGAYANRERILGNVAIYTNTSYVSEPAFGFIGTQVTRWSGGYEEVNELSDVINPLQNRRYYVKSENKIYNWTGSAWAQETSVFAGYLTMDSTAPYNITSLTVNPIRTKNDSKPYILTKGDKRYLFARDGKFY